MKKSLFILCSVCILSCPTYAEMKNIDGYFLGGSVGYITGNSNLTIDGGGVGAFRLGNRNFDLGGSGVGFGINGGYGDFIGDTPYFFSAELFMMMPGYNVKVNNTLPQALGVNPRAHFNTTFKMDNSFGGAVKFGKVFGDILGYFKLGLVSSNWKMSSERMTAVPLALVSKSTSKRAWGIAPGVGFQTKITENTLMGVDYTHTLYKTINFNHETVDNMIYKVPFAIDEFKVSFAYKF